MRLHRAENDLSREISAHLALLEDQFRREGLSEDQARDAARRSFGGIEQVKEHHRDARSFRWIADFRQDIKYGARSFARNPIFTFAAATTLALGIGAATTIFAALYAVVLRPLPYANASRLVRVLEYQPPREAGGAPRRGNPFSPANLDIVRKASTLSHAGLEMPRLMILTNGDAHDRVGGSRLSADIFPMLDAAPLFGRTLEAQDEQPGSDNVVLISHTFWRQRLGGAADVVGKMVILDDRPHMVVGVMKPEFHFPPGSSAEYWTPLVTAGPFANARLSFYARLAGDASIAAARDEIALLYDSARSTSPANRPRLDVVPMKDILIEPFAPAITVLAAAVVLVLLIACVNVATLVLARSIARQHEMSLRTALGASHSRLLRQHLAEGALLATLAGGIGLAIAEACTAWARLLTGPGPRRDMAGGVNIPRLSDITIDLSAVSFAVAISIIAVVAFSFIAVARRRSPIAASLRGEGPQVRSLGGLHRVLVGAEVAMTVVLFIGGALMIRSFMNLSSIDVGFAPRDVLTFQVTLPPSRTPADLSRFGDEMSSRISTMPGVQGVGYAESLPMVPVGRFAAIGRTPALPKPAPGAPPNLDVRIVGPGYLSVMGSRIVKGRDLRASDDAAAARAVVINETLARELFPNEDAIGGQLFLGGGPTFDPKGRTGPLQPWEVVGIVADVRQRSVIDPASPQIFVDQRQVPGPTGSSAVNFAVRIDGDSTAVMSAARGLVAQLDRMAFVENVAPMEALVSATYAKPRLYAWVLGLYALIAICLAGIGIYGVIAFAVAQRTREIGIRIALGARRWQVRALVIRDSAMVVGAGLTVGTIGAIWSSRLFESLLYGVTPLDRVTYIGVTAAFASIALLAAFIPARRASTVDPATTLRHE